MGVILWVTGAPYSGKTTVASQLGALLRVTHGSSVVNLDGDLLRLLLDRSSVEEDLDRRSLGVAYARLAKALARQGTVVIMSAVALYREVFDELSGEPQCAFQIFVLTADADSRSRRAGNLPTEPSSSVHLKQVPQGAVQLDNSDGTDPRRVSERILAHASERLNYVAGHPPPPLNLNDEIVAFARSGTSAKFHWDTFYAGGHAVAEPSQFALFIRNRFPREITGHVVDFGCGNGRDSFFFAGSGHVTGIDSSGQAISLCKMRREAEDCTSAEFIHGDAAALESYMHEYSVDLFYSRFVWHAMTEQQETRVLGILAQHLRPGSLVAIEARSVLDGLASRGAKVSSRERSFGHYRRFHSLDELSARLEGIGTRILLAVEGNGFAPYEGEDPRVLRVIARRY